MPCRRSSFPQCRAHRDKPDFPIGYLTSTDHSPKQSYFQRIIPATHRTSLCLDWHYMFYFFPTKTPYFYIPHATYGYTVIDTFHNVHCREIAWTAVGKKCSILQCGVQHEMAMMRRGCKDMAAGGGSLKQTMYPAVGERCRSVRVLSYASSYRPWYAGSGTCLSLD